MKILKLQNGFLQTMVKVLTYDMPLLQGRMRNRLFALLDPKIKELNKNRLEICNKFAEKDAEGNVKMDEENQFIFPVGEMKVFEELASLFNEDCLIDFPPSMRSDVGGLKGLIEFSTVKLSPLEVSQADAILKAFENVEETPTEAPPLEPAPTV